VRRGYPYATLKNIILSPHHLVAYAGNADLGMHTIRQLKDAPADELTAGLFASAQEAGSGPGAVEFLLAQTERGLQRITNAGVDEPADADWIGDLDAFEAYQRAFHHLEVPETTWIEGVSPPRDQLPDPAATEPFIRMSLALHALQEDSSITSVGEAFVSANSKGRFRYEQQGFFEANHEQDGFRVREGYCSSRSALCAAQSSRRQWCHSPSIPSRGLQRDQAPARQSAFAVEAAARSQAITSAALSCGGKTG
jgi:hypothetical protein